LVLLAVFLELRLLKKLPLPRVPLFSSVWRNISARALFGSTPRTSSSLLLFSLMTHHSPAREQKSDVKLVNNNEMIQFTVVFSGLFTVKVELPG